MSLQSPHRDPHEAAVVWEDLGGGCLGESQSWWEATLARLNHKTGVSSRGLLLGNRGPGRRAEKPEEPLLVTWGCYRIRDLRKLTLPVGQPTKHANFKAVAKETKELSQHLPTSRAEAPQRWCSRNPAGQNLVPSPGPERLPTAEKSVELSVRGGEGAGGGDLERLDNLVLENSSS